MNWRMHSTLVLCIFLYKVISFMTPFCSKILTFKLPNQVPKVIICPVLMSLSRTRVAEPQFPWKSLPWPAVQRGLALCIQGCEIPPFAAQWFSWWMSPQQSQKSSPSSSSPWALLPACSPRLLLPGTVITPKQELTRITEVSGCSPSSSKD